MDWGTARRAGGAVATGGGSEIYRYSRQKSPLTNGGQARKMPWDHSKANDLSKEGERNAQQQYDDSQPILGRMNQADSDYQKQYGNNAQSYKAQRDPEIDRYLGRSEQLRTEASEQGKSAQSTYTNDIQPRMKANMESAMTLAEAGDPNNKVQTDVRAMYDKQGQAARTQGMQDFGVLSALGSQAAGQQFGAGTPMTAGMQGQIYAANQGQAGNAYAKAQQRMHDLQQQGIDRGFDESSKQYDRGQNATKDFIDAEGVYAQRGRDNRDELNSYDSDRFGVKMGQFGENRDMDMGFAGIGRDNSYAQGERDLGALGQKYGTQQSIITNRLSAEEARKRGEQDTLVKLGQTGAGYAGGGGK